MCVVSRRRGVVEDEVFPLAVNKAQWAARCDGKRVEVSGEGSETRWVGWGGRCK